MICRICRHKYPAYYVVDGVCEDCRYDGGFSRFRWSRRICDRVLRQILEGDYVGVAKGIEGESYWVIVGLVLRFLEGYEWGERRFLVGELDDISQKPDRYEVEDFRHSKVLRDLEEGIDSGKREYRRLRYEVISRRKRQRLCEGKYVGVKRADTEEVIRDWFDSKERHWCEVIERSGAG